MPLPTAFVSLSSTNRLVWVSKTFIFSVQSLYSSRAISIIRRIAFGCLMAAVRLLLFSLVWLFQRSAYRRLLCLLDILRKQLPFVRRFLRMESGRSSLCGPFFLADKVLLRHIFSSLLFRHCRVIVRPSFDLFEVRPRSQVS